MITDAENRSTSRQEGGKRNGKLAGTCYSDLLSWHGSTAATFSRPVLFRLAYVYLPLPGPTHRMLSSFFLLFALNLFALAVDSASCATHKFNHRQRGGHEDYAIRNLHTVQAIYNLTVYPHNAPIIQQGGSAVPDGLFGPSATGRITPLGNFTGFEDSIEYFFGLAPLPQANPAGVAIFKAEVVEFSSGCPEVASSVVYLYAGKVNQTTGELLDGAKVTPLKQVGLFKNCNHNNSTLMDFVFSPFLPRSPFGVSMTRDSSANTMLGFLHSSYGLRSLAESTTATHSFKLASLVRLYVQRSRRTVRDQTSSSRTNRIALRS